jgi:hypothetical protein
MCRWLELSSCSKEEAREVWALFLYWPTILSSKRCKLSSCSRQKAGGLELNANFEFLGLLLTNPKPKWHHIYIWSCHLGNYLGKALKKFPLIHWGVFPLDLKPKWRPFFFFYQVCIKEPHNPLFFKSIRTFKITPFFVCLKVLSKIPKI